MKKARLAAQSRAQLDTRFREFGPGERYASPVRGWIKAIREALGMSMAQLAERLKIKQRSRDHKCRLVLPDGRILQICA